MPPWLNMPARRPARRIPLLVAAIAVIVAVAVLVALAVVGGSAEATQGKSRPAVAPTATATATPTATVMPTPTAMPGFKVYLNGSQDLLLQYPASWTVTSTFPGTVFQNNPRNFSYEVKVDLPDPNLLGAQGNDAADASAWVDYELHSFTTLYGDQFQPVTGPTPAIQFANAQWQSGVGFIGQGRARVRVEVYATVHNGRPIIVNLLAAESAFSFAEEDFFGPMLQSFAFLTPQA